MKIDRHGDLFGPVRRISLQGQLETEVIKGRRPQFPGKPMDVAHQAFGKGFQMKDVVPGLGDGGVLFAKELKAEFNSGQFLAEAVVQFARDSAAFGFFGLSQTPEDLLVRLFGATALGDF